MTTESGTTEPEERADPGGVFDDRILTVPNVLSVVRLLGVPLFLWLMLVEHADGWAFALLIASGVTDFLDGKLARLLDQSSRLGALLDPFVDRLYLVTTLLAFVLRGLIPWWVAVILVGRDLVLTGTLTVYKRRDLPPPDVIYLGKAATFALMSALPWLLAGEMDWAIDGFGRAFGGALLVWGTAVYVWTGLLYTGKAIAVARSIPAVPHRPT
ncbi:CDP-diacylglycerol--glycerol-3-phosphate 3-phosphatidyltransferase/cardiolipin synthase [Nocardia tenerifensis]|uniref:CDP-diacylglycerol--glycerol-3-phosphate 3-phosphatidyltransferase/cardiolipin synthase n=1 Tax=Nocardia tenerifensis TaxID=228006 RepID=A0A318JWE3_9NOCA|nr:CDP-alcohol phosphatidyltransferase family protein [Nocardia tenerifensis]PXX58397.1 CDP-diacylglycerol--glycerol-3-phosphate 3-phosphatidyltransferase/cardiolipin synthase [Nocardia tenerifensis]